MILRISYNCTTKIKYIECDRVELVEKTSKEINEEFRLKENLFGLEKRIEKLGSTFKVFFKGNLIETVHTSDIYTGGEMPEGAVFDLYLDDHEIYPDILPKGHKNKRR